MTEIKLREALNRMDHKALDSLSEYYDLVTLYEAAKPLSNDEKKMITDATKTGNPDLVNQAFSKIQMDRNPNMKNKLNQIDSMSSKVESFDLNEYDDLDEGRNDLKAEPEKSIESGRTHYVLRDTKTGELATFEVPYWYPTKQGAQAAIQDKSRDLGYGKSKTKLAASLDIHDNNKNILSEGTITKGPFEVEIYFDNKKGKYRAKADDGIHGIANCRFPSDLRDKDSVYIVSQLDWLGDQYNVPRKVITGEKSDIEMKKMQDAGVVIKDDDMPEFSDDFFESLNEDDEYFIPSNIFYQFGDTEFNEDDIQPEMLQMIKAPVKKNGELKAQAVAILRIYDHLVNNGEPYVSREQILKESGVANWNRQGEHSTWFTEFGLLGLAELHDGDGTVSEGPNLRGWVEGTVTPTSVWRHRDGTTDPIGPGNIKGMDLRPYVEHTNNVKVRADQGIQPDRSHGKGDTTTADTQLKASGIVFKDGMLEFPDEFFESVEADKVDTNDIIKNRTDKINKLYRKYMSLDEDAEITEDSINDWGVSHVCAMNGWDENCVRSALLKKE